MPNEDYLKTTSFLTGAQVDQKIDESMLEVTDTNGVIISSDESAGSSLVYTFSSATYTATVASGGGYTSTAIWEIPKFVRRTAANDRSETLDPDNCWYKVTGIGADAFNGCSNITKITLPSTITTIGARAFSGCTGLSYILIPKSVTSIGANAFTDCGTATAKGHIDIDIIKSSTLTGKPWGAPDGSTVNYLQLVTDTQIDTWNGKQDALSEQTPYTSQGTSTKVPTITTNSLGQVTKITETTITFPSSDVTSVQIQGTNNQIVSSDDSAQSGAVSTTISLANGYGDGKNPYNAKSKNTVLAGPNGSQGNTVDAQPTFRALVKADLPSLSASDVGVAISTTTGSESITVDNSTLNIVTRGTAQTIDGDKTIIGTIKGSTTGDYGLKVPNTSDWAANKTIATTADLANKVDSNATIIGATKCKITYDSKGLVTAGADLQASDIPALAYLPDSTKYGKSLSVSGTSVSLKDQDGNVLSTITTQDTNTATAADNILDGSNNGTQITYKPYTDQQQKLSFDTSASNPSRTDRLNLNGNLYATNLYTNTITVGAKAAMKYNSSTESIEFIFS